MKKKYIAPNAEILLLEVSDVIIASGGSASGENGAYDDDFGDFGNAVNIDNWN